MRRIGLMIVCCISMMAACVHKSETPTPATNNNGGNNGGNNNPNPADTGICFSRDILPIFIANCAQSGCHDAASAKEGFVFTSYETITRKEFVPGNADATELYEAITEDDVRKRMPQYPNPALTSEQKALIRRWINEGAKNTTGCSTPCDSNNYLYSTAVKPMMEKYCVGCHNGTVANKGVRLDTYDGVRTAAVNGRLLDAIRHSAGVTPMPSGGAKLSDCQIQQVSKWVAAGALNN